MGHFIEQSIDDIKKQPMTILQWMLGFVGIFFIRFFLETFSSPTSSGIIPSDPYTFMHYGLFFLATVLGTACIVGFITKEYENTLKVVLLGLPIIWLAPVIDLVVSGGAGFKMTYIFDTGGKLLLDFVTFFGPQFTGGATYGMRIEIALILIGASWYIYTVTKNYTRTVVGVILIYAFGFFVGSLPGILYTLSHAGGGEVTDVIGYFETLVTQSTISHNTLHEGMSSVSSGRFLELGFNKLMSQILFILSSIFATILFWKISVRKFWAIVKNIRIERIGSYLALLIAGMGFAYISKLNIFFFWTDLLGIISLLLAWIGLWMHAVHLNDIADISIDTLSNTDRPLIKREVTVEEMRDSSWLWLTLALLGSWVSGFYPFFMAIIFITASYIYSCPPLRLRRFPLVPSFLIGIASLATILAGFFFISIHKDLRVFSIPLASGIVVMATLAINVKDIKDIEGDKKDGVVTLPILFGERGIQAVALCFALSFLLVPLFLKFYFLYILALPCAIVGYKLVMKKPYREMPTFVLRFVFLFGVAGIYLFGYWLAHIYNLI
jgi:geranylgeranylglycerol-phosphate geranylgeranyltransferase